MSESTANLLPYQNQAISRILETKRMLVNLPAGSGKSVVALSVAVKNKSKRILVICPAFLRLNWTYELKKWFPGSQLPDVIESIDDAKYVSNKSTTFAIVGYSFFSDKSNAKYLITQKWDQVICDESHYVRKWESKRCKNVIQVTLRSKNVVFLSATPLVSSAADLHPTFSIMQPGLWGNFGEFKDRYCNKERDVFNPTGWRYTGIKKENAAELRNKAKPFVFTRKKTVILSQLPPKRVITLPLNIGKCKEFDESLSQMLDRIIDTGIEDEEIKTERERIGLAKVESVIELLSTFPKTEPVVIFAWHRSVINALFMELCKSDHIKIIIGGMSERLRMQCVKEFTEGAFNRFIISISAGGLGINLQRAAIAVFAELPYSYAEFEQCSDRVHRLGSTKKVRIYKAVAVNSLDERLDEIIETKRKAAEAAGVAT